MTTYAVEPHVGVGPIKLSMSRAAARAAMLAAGQTHVADTHAARDLFHRNSFQVWFDAGDVVEYIELSRDADFEATLQAVRILQLPVDQAVRFVERFAPYSTTDPELGWSYVFPMLDLSLWRPVTEGPEARTFATVGIGRAGYYARV